MADNNLLIVALSPEFANRIVGVINALERRPTVGVGKAKMISLEDADALSLLRDSITNALTDHMSKKGPPR